MIVDQKGICFNWSLRAYSSLPSFHDKWRKPLMTIAHHDIPGVESFGRACICYDTCKSAK